jgi:ribulose-phosphate 3-epimerase
MGTKLSPSLMSADFGAFAAAAEMCDRAGAEFLHFDVMDGLFVPNITFGKSPLTALKPHTKATFDAHLMIVQPERYVEDFVKAGADYVTVHAEATTHLQRTLALIRHAGGKAGLALNPTTSLNVLDYILDDIDLLLVLTINPGFSGQEFIPATLNKIAEARAILDKARHPIELEVDGGIHTGNVKDVIRAGATLVVSGSGIFGNPDGPAAGIHAMKQAMAGA